MANKSKMSTSNNLQKKTDGVLILVPAVAGKETEMKRVYLVVLSSMLGGCLMDHEVYDVFGNESDSKVVYTLDPSIGSADMVADSELESKESDAIEVDDE